MKKKFAEVSYILTFILILLISAINYEVDLQVSVKMFAPKSIIGLITEVLAELPIDFALLLSASYIIVVGIRKKGGKRVFYVVMGFLFSVVGGFYAGFIPITFVRLFFEGGSSPLYFISIPIVIIVSLLFMNKFYNKYGEKYLKIAFLCCTYFLISFLISYAIKIPFGRMRFRDMEPPFNHFSPWYIINGVTGNDSFPSGHVINASFIFYIIFIVQKFLNCQNERLSYYILAGIWIMFVAYGRVIVGAHFLSDIAMGALIGFCLFQLMKAITNKLLNRIVI